MSYKAAQDFNVSKAEQTLLDVIQACERSDETLLSICNKALSLSHCRIVQIKVRQYVPDAESVKEENEKNSSDEYHFLPSVGPAYECLEYMQGLQVYMDEKMFKFFFEEQMIIICLLLLGGKEMFDAFNRLSFTHEAYREFPSFHRAVTTIRQALKYGSAL